MIDRERRLSPMEHELENNKQYKALLEQAEIEGCTDTALKIVAFEMVGESPFVVPRDLLQERNSYQERQEFAGEFQYSDFMAQVNLLNQYLQLNPAERDEWCNKHSLRAGVLNSVAAKYEKLVFYLESKDISAEDIDLDPDAIGRTILAGFKDNLMLIESSSVKPLRLIEYKKLGNHTNTKHSPFYNPKSSSLLSMIDTGRDLPEYPEFIVASGLRSRYGRKPGNFSVCHPIKLEWLFQLYPESIGKEIRYNFNTDDFDCKGKFKVGNSAFRLGEGENIPISDDEKAETFAQAFNGNVCLQQYYSLITKGESLPDFFESHERYTQNLLTKNNDIAEDYLVNLLGYDEFDAQCERDYRFLPKFLSAVYKKLLQGVYSKEILRTKIEASRCIEDEEGGINLQLEGQEHLLHEVAQELGLV